MADACLCMCVYMSTWHIKILHIAICQLKSLVVSHQSRNIISELIPEITLCSFGINARIDDDKWHVDVRKILSKINRFRVCSETSVDFGFGVVRVRIFGDKYILLKYIFMNFVNLSEFHFFLYDVIIFLG